jgi:hypothetical protein
MANDIFGSIGGFFDSIAKGVVPANTPDSKIVSAQVDIKNLKAQESQVMEEIGRAAYEANPTAWEQDDKIKLIRQNLASAQAVLDEATKQKEAEEAAKTAQSQALTCPNPECGHINPEGTKFCQNCGTKLGIETPTKTFCTSCGAELAAGTKFCGSCGAKQFD